MCLRGRLDKKKEDTRWQNRIFRICLTVSKLYMDQNYSNPLGIPFHLIKESIRNSNSDTSY